MWTPGPAWMDAENLAPSGFNPQTIQPIVRSLYQLSYPSLLVYLLPLLCKIVMMCRAHFNFYVCGMTYHVLMAVFWVTMHLLEWKKLAVFYSAGRNFSSLLMFDSLFVGLSIITAYVVIVLFQPSCHMHYWNKYKHIFFSGNFLLGLNISD